MDLNILLRDIFKKIQKFSGEHEKYILEYLEHREWELALISICSAIEQGNITIDKKDFCKIEEAGLYMDLDKLFWESIQTQ
ncbi:MafI family immunity protein [Paenisporosarcina sp. FSL H8-0542]|uniref:MafI family immunity protein n=1 Tax=Paenisporosarcina sp. FSL H8-0542 TaxID=2921401 RepID=UPI00315A3317